MSTTLKLVQFSDCHLFASPEKTGYADINPYRCLSKVLAAIKDENPDFIVNTGDVSGDYSAESYQHYQRLWQDVGIDAPVFSVAGNHDQLDFWQQCFNTVHAYRIESLSKNWKIHILASDFDGTIGTVNRQSLNALVDKVARHSELQHLIVIHHPLTDSKVWMDKHYLKNAAQVRDTIETLPIKAVLHGHVHTDRRVMLGKIPVFSCPSTCWQWGNTPEFSVAKEPPGYRVFEFDETGKYNTFVKYVN